MKSTYDNGKGGFRPAGIKGPSDGPPAKICKNGMYRGDSSLPVMTKGTMSKGGGKS